MGPMHPDGHTPPPLYRVLRGLSAPIVRRLFSLHVTGAEALPATGPVIVAANHHNYLDGVVLAVAVARPIAFLVMPRVWNASPLHPPFHRRIGSIPVNLERPDPGAIKRVLRLLEDGGVVGIFPEGPFSREGRLVGGQPGVALLALRSGAPVVPVAIDGTFEALRGRPWRVPRRHPLRVRLGAPMTFGARRHPLARAEREEVTRRIMSEIDRLLGARAGAPPVTPDGVTGARAPAEQAGAS
jgi:1-acyl-sn-glycerol-3-phosphate acyltransferase